jgi:hypothetical protein
VARRFFERRLSLITRAFGSPKTPHTVRAGRKPGLNYPCRTLLRSWRSCEAGLRFYNGHYGLLSFSKKYNVSLAYLYGMSNNPGCGGKPKVPPIRLATVDGKRVA